MAFWDQILGILGKAVLKTVMPFKIIEKALEWVENAVSATLRKIEEAVGSERFWPALHKLVEKAELKPKALAEIRVYHEAHGVPIPIPF